MKVAYYLDNSLIYDVDLTGIKNGNPGIGGTEYLFVLVPLILSEADNGIDITLYIRKEQKLPNNINAKLVGSLSEAISDAENCGSDYFVIKHDVDNIYRDALTSNTDMKFIVWCHVFVCFWELDYYNVNPYVYKIVFVGREHRDLYRDHPIYPKTSFIYNCINLDGCRDLVYDNKFEKRGNIVTYVGSLVPFKGFHLLAKAWPHVLKVIPDAQLYVIGSGKVYNSELKLGKYGITDESYEDVFLKYLTQDGDIIPSVHFMGRMGEEKSEILLKTKVGVPNPSGITETFCLSAVEMQAMGARIATIKAPGYIDTIRNGILYKKDSELAGTIVSLLKNSSTDYDSAMVYFESTFSPEAVRSKWELLIHGHDESESSFVNPGYRFKWLKECIRKLHNLIPVSKRIPPIERILIFIERKVLGKTTFMDSNLKI